MERETFEARHHGPLESAALKEMFAEVGVGGMDELMDACLPSSIRSANPYWQSLPEAHTEEECLRRLRVFADQNKVLKSYIGQGYAEARLPGVIARNVLQNPAWYTAYTPYQAEISQGRLSAMLYFQTMVADVCALPLANASLLDEATAAAEAMMMCYRSRPSTRQEARTLLVVGKVFRQTHAVLCGRAKQLGLCVRQVGLAEAEALLDSQEAKACYAVLIQYPDAEGALTDKRELFKAAQAQDLACIACVDLLSLMLLSPPGEWGADVVVGNSQRFGIPLGFGGPHAAFMAAKAHYKRQLPGRIVGRSKDALGDEALYMALQTREQHIRRGSATSNICTSQALLAVMAAFYAIYHGPKGLKSIAMRIHKLCVGLAEELDALGLAAKHTHFFDTLFVSLSPTAQVRLRTLCEEAGYNLYYDADEHHVGITLGELSTEADVRALAQCFGQLGGEEKAATGGKGKS